MAARQVAGPMALLRGAAGAAARLVLVPLVGFGLVGWWLIGDLSEPGGEDAILQLPLAQRNAAALGLVGLVVAAGWALDFVRGWWGTEHRTPAAWLSAAGISAGVLAAFGMRVVTARVGGANIGGGMVILASPVPAVALFVLTAVLSLRIAGCR